MSNEMKDWLEFHRSLSAEQVLEDGCIANHVWGDTPFDKLMEIIGFDNSVSVYFAFEKLMEDLNIIKPEFWNSENLFEHIKHAIRYRRDEETRNKGTEEEIKKRLCQKCRQSEGWSNEVPEGQKDSN